LRLDTSWARDTRDSFLFPTKGLMQRLSAEVGTPLGSLQYYKLTTQHQQYFPLGKKFTLMLNGEAGVGDGLGSEPLPFYKNLYAGGNSSVRGFENGTLGPKDVNKNAIGGNTRVIGNAELFFPLPGLKDDNSLRMSAFIDGGAAFDATPAFDELRFSAGLAVLWVSPLGPLKFSLAQPLVTRTDDKTEVFQFTLGNSF
jgi:outer membrane protein insertion porin family